MLTISSEKEQEKEERDNENYYRKEFSYQSFSDLLILITRMKTKSMLIIKMAYCMLLLPKREGGKKKTAKTIAIK
jgi:HSP20 family protein